MEKIPQNIILIAGSGDYPLLLADAARKQGVEHISTLAFKGETSRSIEEKSDEVTWVYAGSLDSVLGGLKEFDAHSLVMVGQVSPKNLFNACFDKAMIKMIGGLKVKNAHTIFGAFIGQLSSIEKELLPASLFMSEYMPKSGVLTKRPPNERELNDIEIGRRVIKDTSHLDIGQTVVVKEGMILAVEAFEGTNKAIKRGGKLGGKGSVVVKVPKEQHDMRFDIPVIGKRTILSLKKAKASCLAIEENGAIMLNEKEVVAQANNIGLAIVVLEKNR